MRTLLIVAAITLFGAACTAVTVKPADPSLGINYVCIENNPRVIVSDFVTVLRDGFDRHGIATELTSGARLRQCEFVLKYTALQSWDMAKYLSHAELRLESNGQQIAYAEYHLKGKGGFSLTKWGDTKTKIDPVVDELLAGYVREPNAPRPAAPIHFDDGVDKTTTGRDKYADLERLRMLLDDGTLTQEEFDNEKAKILDKN